MVQQSTSDTSQQQPDESGIPSQQQPDESGIPHPTPRILNNVTTSDIESNWLNNKGLHICHLYIQYLYPKLDEIKILLYNQPNIDIFCLCETFLHNEFSDEELRINGLILFIKTDQVTEVGLTFNRPVDLETNNLGTIWLDLKINKQKAFLICYCYRPPSSTVDWISNMENTIEQAFLDNMEVIILGDFNFNLLLGNSNSKSWIRTFNSLHLNQIIDKPTRVTGISETLIDHACTNVPENIIEHTVPHYSM